MIHPKLRNPTTTRVPVEFMMVFENSHIKIILKSMERDLLWLGIGLIYLLINSSCLLTISLSRSNKICNNCFYFKIYNHYHACTHLDKVVYCGGELALCNRQHDDYEPHIYDVIFNINLQLH